MLPTVDRGTARGTQMLVTILGWPMELYRQRGRRAFQRVVNIIPDNPKGWQNLGNAYLESSLGADAVKAYR